jgi:hypothetical protein
VIDRVGRRLLQAADVPAREGHQQHGRGGDDRGVALLALEHAHLAEHVAGAQIGDVLAVAVDARGALLDGQDVVGVVALAHQLLALGDRDLGRERRDVV